MYFYTAIYVEFSDLSGGAGFPGGSPFGMPGLNDLLKDPEVLMAMQVTFPTFHLENGNDLGSD